MVPQIRSKEWAGFWQGLDYPTIEELTPQVSTIVEWEEMFVRQIRMDQLEQYLAMREVIGNGETTV